MFGRRPDDELQRRVSALERQVAELRSRLDATSAGDRTARSEPSAWPTVPAGNTVAEVSSQVLDLVRRGRKIEAIKEYRAQYGVGLKEAKDAVDRIG